MKAHPLCLSSVNRKLQKTISLPLIDIDPPFKILWNFWNQRNRGCRFPICWDSRTYCFFRKSVGGVPLLISGRCTYSKFKYTWFWESWTRPLGPKQMKKTFRIFPKVKVKSTSPEMKQNNYMELAGYLVIDIYNKTWPPPTHPPAPKTGIFPYPL